MTDPSRSPKRPARRRTKASHTAAKVARGMVLLSRDPVHASLYPEGAAESVERFALAAGAVRPWMTRLFENGWYGRLFHRTAEKFWPGELIRLTLRKRFVDDEVRAAIREGCGQLLVMGAGFDTLGLRMAAAFADLTVADVDTPATAEQRRAVINEIGAHHSNHHTVGVDLATVALGEALNGVSGWDPTARSVVVAEGVVMYLTEAEVTAFLGELRSNTGSGSRLVFTYLGTDEQGRPYMGRWSGLTRMSAKLVGEPLLWGVRGGELVGFLEARGFRLLGPPDRYDMRKRYLLPAGIDQPASTIEGCAVAESA